MSKSNLKQRLAHPFTSQAKQRPELETSDDYQEHIFPGGYQHFQAMIQDIDNAKQQIDLEMYIFSKDNLGEQIVTALIAAAQRGIKVRVLVDGCGTPLWSASYARRLEQAGAETKVFHPFPWQLWNWSRATVRWPMLLKWIYLMLKINSRNHRKLCIIDQKIAYIGSVNISKCHLETDNGGDNWRDITVRLANLDLTELEAAFDSAWNHRSIKERLRDAFHMVRRDPIIRLNFSRHRRRFLYKNLLRKMRQCKKRIWITNAYFVPDNFLLRRLKDAASKGVDVRIVLPRHSDVMMMPWASSTFYFTLLKAGVRIFEYLPSVLHAKSLLLDDWAMIGSSNLNHRSLLHDLEVDVNLRRDESIKTLEQLFLNDIQHAKEVSLDSWQQQRPRRQRLLGRIVLYIKYWI